MYLSLQVKKMLKNVGITLDRYPTGDLRRRLMLLKYFEINKIIDIGANVGQYGKLLRKLGFNGEIISYEPIKDTYLKLEKATLKDPKWKAFHNGVGDSKTTMEINISKNNVSSSFQGMKNVHLEESPDSEYIRKEKVDVITIDSVYKDLCEDTDRVMLKVDTQGFEKNVIVGATESLSKIFALQLELSLSQTYENEPYFLEMIDVLGSYGFQLFSVETGYFNKKSGQLYQMDGIFLKKEFDQK
jgi:FkbM family methyltransferase